jgi:hypothetical protein
MFSAPGEKVFVLPEVRFDELIQYVVSRFSQEAGVCKQDLVVLDIQTRNVSNNLLAAGAGFNHRHGRLLCMKRAAISSADRGWPVGT